MTRKYSPVPCPRQLAVVSIDSIAKFVEDINRGRSCTTPSCTGKLFPYSIKLKGVGGTFSISYLCQGCGFHPAHFEGSSINQSMQGNRITDIGASITVAFIATYYKVMKLALGITNLGHIKAC